MYCPSFLSWILSILEFLCLGAAATLIAIAPCLDNGAWESCNVIGGNITSWPQQMQFEWIPYVQYIVFAISLFLAATVMTFQIVLKTNCYRQLVTKIRKAFLVFAILVTLAMASFEVWLSYNLHALERYSAVAVYALVAVIFTLDLLVSFRSINKSSSYEFTTFPKPSEN